MQDWQGDLGRSRKEVTLNFKIFRVMSYEWVF